MQSKVIALLLGFKRLARTIKFKLNEKMKHLRILILRYKMCHEPKFRSSKGDYKNLWS